LSHKTGSGKLVVPIYGYISKTVECRGKIKINY